MPNLGSDDGRVAGRPGAAVHPPVPDDLADLPVAAWSEPVTIDSYLPTDPDPFPMFLNSRVYQGSNGRVLPLPFHERIEPEKRPHRWQAVHLENDWLRVMVLPELGGRIHLAYDKSADYDLFYRNTVIKPALVGLAGPWIAGGIEFNWPQHHRPATFLPTDVCIEHEPDGAVTVWCSDHDPFTRMKGMHGIRLRPDSAVIEARVRLTNRTDDTRTFLWWANVAAAVNDDYQSFFPADVTTVADHARRAVVGFPQADGSYYGVDYPAAAQESPGADRLDWWRNIPVPTSYMATGSTRDFFGGYDHGARAGFVHWADHHISPGKKQWTWGNSEFGRAWERNLTDADGPYIELMAGVFTDNQPDFAYLAPGETKTFSQYWYPIQQIGIPQDATLEAAGRLDVPAGDRTLAGAGGAGGSGGTASLALCTPLREAEFDIEVLAGTAVLHTGRVRLEGGGPEVIELPLGGNDPTGISVIVRRDGRDVLRLGYREEQPATPIRPALEPGDPQDIDTVEELFEIGQYLEQYRHATRSPEPYWQEGLAQDPFDVRCNVALGARRHRAGRHAEAEVLLRRAIERQTEWTPTPASGEAHYRLGCVLVATGDHTGAAEAFGRAQWDAAWWAPSNWQLARIACRAGDLGRAETVLAELCRREPDRLQAADLLAALLQHTGRSAEADILLARVLEQDPLDQWALLLAGRATTTDPPTLLDIALEFATAGLVEPALDALDRAEKALPRTAIGQVNVGPLIDFHRAALHLDTGDTAAAASAIERAESANPVGCQASRPQDIAALLRVTSDGRPAPLAHYLLGCWLLHSDRPSEAAKQFRAALSQLPPTAVATLAHRALGIVLYNHNADAAGAVEQYRAALALDPDSPRLWYESDQLSARTGVTGAERLRHLRSRPDIVEQRDDLTVVLADLSTADGDPAMARDLLRNRKFQPWEGGEGRVLAAWENAQLALAERALADGRPGEAVAAVQEALAPPESLAEARHPLAFTVRLQLTLARAQRAAGDPAAADQARRCAVAQRDRLVAEIDHLAGAGNGVDFFATSLPSLLLFTDDPGVETAARLADLRAQLADL